jgi:hypothetical protein
MVARQLSALPVETLVHVKDDNVPQTHLFLIDQSGKGLVPTARSTGNDGPEFPAHFTSGLDLVNKLSRHEVPHIPAVLAEAEWDPALGMALELLIGYTTPFIKFIKRKAHGSLSHGNFFRTFRMLPTLLH